MIYVHMLEKVNDSINYCGVVDLARNVRNHLIPHLQDLQIPVMRWPGGTVLYEYHWQHGIGPKNPRPSVPTLAWNGVETSQFGTDEFLRSDERRVGKAGVSSCSMRWLRYIYNIRINDTH